MPIRIGCGAGFSGDRLEPALVLAEHGGLDYLVLECLAERTIALAQKRKRQNPSEGYDPLLERRMRGLLPLIVSHNIRLLTNMGAANPLAAAQKTLEIARELGLSVKVAVVLGDDVLPFLSEPQQFRVLEGGRSLSDYKLVSANAYLGTEALLGALQADAQVVITGRVADPSLFLAPMMHAFGWTADNWDLLGKGTVIGHLLECAGQITGGYYADPLKKPVSGMEALGHPYAEVSPDGSAVITKVQGTGGVVNLQTVKEQLLYEVIDPHAYYTPDVIADFTSVHLQETGPDQVLVQGGVGRPRPDTYKVSVGYQAGFLGEAEIAYAGAGAMARAQLAGEILEKRLRPQLEELRIDYIGCGAVHREHFGNNITPYEIRVRAAGRAQLASVAALIGEEVEALYTNGPAAGGGVRKNTVETIGIVSVLLDRTLIKPYFVTL